MKNKRVSISVAAFIAILAILLGVYLLSKPKPTQGDKKIIVEVVDNESNSTSYNLTTNSSFLREALDELSTTSDFSYEGEESEYGVMINTVNGITADYETDGAYWAIYVNGEYGQYGADQQPIVTGDTYSLKYEKN